LNLQFYLWKDALQFNLHPSIPSPTHYARIADVATGTGIWLVDIAQSLPPSVQLEGFDISLTQCPVRAWLPDNIKLHKWDMFTEPPEDLVGRFDIVHIRLVTLVIKDNNPVPLITNLRKLLKPGGYLQWDEVEPSGTYIETVNSSVSIDVTKSLFRLDIPTSARGSDDWQQTLQSSLNQYGFQEAEKHQYNSNLTMARYWHDMYMLSWEEFVSKVTGGSVETLKAADKAMEEAQNGAAVTMPKLVWVARAV